LAGTTVVVACDRHHLSQADAVAVAGAEAGAGSSDAGLVVLESVRCAGVVGPDLVQTLTKRGAERIEVVGCARDDCRYGVGNTLAEARIAGTVAPHLARAHRSKVGRHWVAPGEVLRLQDETGFWFRKHWF
jgi:coenzyme F420-reducing hydrogenase delta subunit